MHVVSANTTYQYLTPLDLHVSSFNLTQLREPFDKNEDLAEVLTSIQTIHDNEIEITNNHELQNIEKEIAKVQEEHEARIQKVQFP